MNYQFKKLINFCLKLILCHLSISQTLKVFHFKNNKKKRISIEKNKNFWSASSAEKTTFSQKAQLPQKPAFHPSLGAHCRPATPGFQSGLQARPCAEAHTKKRRVLRKQKPQHAKHAGIRAASPAVRGSAHEKKTGFAEAKAAACEACKHPGCKRTRKLYQNYPNFQKKLQKSGQKCSKNCICSENCPKSACQKMKNRKFAVFTVYFFQKIRSQTEKMLFYLRFLTWHTFCL